MNHVDRSSRWKWWICGLLLFASTINYMDRQTLANAAVRITRQFDLTQEQYGNLELVFGWAFAIGSMAFGVLVDRMSVRWLYPVILLLWSAVGFATGLADSYQNLLICRGLLGLFEGGHWPCAVKTTQRLLDPKYRAMGNSVLQSGTSIGAIITPLIMRLMLTDDPGSWRLPFMVVGAVGLVWILAWFALVRRGDLAHVAVIQDPAAATAHALTQPPVGKRPSQKVGLPETSSETSSETLSKGQQRADSLDKVSDEVSDKDRPRSPLRRSRGTRPTMEGAADDNEARESIWRLLFSRRMIVLFVVIAAINTCWQTLRAWLPKFLQEGRGYAEADALYFNSLFYVATDVGCLGAGALTLWLCRRGLTVHRARLSVFGACAALCILTTMAALLPQGWLLLAVLLVVGAGALGLFPIYHALTQEISPHHQGKVTGITGVAAWAFSPPAQTFFGRLIDRTGSFDLGLAVVGWTPLLAFLALWLFWDRRGTVRR